MSFFIVPAPISFLFVREDKKQLDFGTKEIVLGFNVFSLINFK